MWTVKKSFTFDMAHRLINYEGPCAHLHGHTYTAVIEYGSEKLDDQGFVLDFKEVTKLIKTKVDALWDHGIMLHKDDPLVKRIQNYTSKIFVIDDNPSAENIAKNLFFIAQTSINTKKRNCYLISVSIKETPTSEATYRG